MQAGPLVVSEGEPHADDGPMGKLIQFDEEARGALRRGVDQLAGAVRVTLGPRGRNVVIDRRSGTPTITNDGLTIAREIELENPFENMGVQLLREVALKTGQVAGDGTTTATVLAHSMVVHGLKAVASGRNPIAIKRGMDRAVELVVSDLRRQARQVNDHADLERVAWVSAGDPAIGAMIADALQRVGPQGVVTIDEGRALRDTLEVVEGMRFDEGYLSPYFVTDPETMQVVLENPLVLLTDLRVTAAEELLDVLEHAAQARRPLLVVAEDVEAEALATMVVNRLRGTLQDVAVRAAGAGDRRRELLEDLAVFTGATVVTREMGRALRRFRPEDLGRARRVMVERDTTTLIEGGGRAPEIRGQLERLERELRAAESGFDRDGLRQRIGRLSGGVAVIRVGGATELELGERKSRFEDALAATRSAVEEGMVTGGGVALLRTQRALDAAGAGDEERAGFAIVRAALEQPARQIAENAGEPGAAVVERMRSGEGGFGYDALANRFCDLDSAGIVDPAKVTRCALQHAASIGTLVLTTDAIVVDAPETEEEPPAAEE
jgi:chaperonin GroEL